MSTVETPAKNPNLVEFEREYDGFDNELKPVKAKVKVSFVEVHPVYPENATDEQKKAADDEANKNALEILNKINRWQEAANFLLRKEALADAKKRAGISGGINRAVLMEFIKPYRELPQFSGMIAASDKRKATAEEWDKQTNAILDQIRNVEFIIAAIRTKSAQVDAEEGENA